MIVSSVIFLHATRLSQSLLFTARLVHFSSFSMFAIEPKTRKLFKFPLEGDIRDDPKFHMHAQTIFQMIDFAVSFLGPDMDMLKEDLVALGKRHIHYGVKPLFLPVMEKSVIHALEELLAEKFTKDDRKAWQIVFHYLIAQMTIGMEEKD
jgi:hemoglobin-like flavoprotein